MEKTKLNSLFTPLVAACYYGVIIGMLLLWSNGDIPGVLRYPFAVLPFLPVLFVDKRWFFPSLFAALTVFNNMPKDQFQYNQLFYIGMIGIVLIYYGIRDRQIISPFEFAPFVLTLAYMMVVDFATDNALQQCHRNLSVAVSAMLALGTSSQPSQRIEGQGRDCAYAFVIASIVISIVYWLNFDIYAEDYGWKTGLIRSFYTDPNYQGCTIGMGVVLAVWLLLNDKAAVWWQRILCAVGIAVPLVTVFTLASRGALVAVAGAVILLVLVSDTRKGYKALVVLLGIVFVAYAYSNHYMDLVIARLHEKDMLTGASRLLIWKSKMISFFRDTNPLHWLFGMGYWNALECGDFITAHMNDGLAYSAFHNQFLSVLVTYGLVGLAGFVVLLWLPIHKAVKGNKLLTAVLVSYLILVCMTLEPLTIGHIAFYFYYMFVYIQATR
ncbi:MAG: O-antigen ligase family protein [Paludibacteraceae bacterium]|nr:O-antigen ligase family protein [Paludibacteraceae bacterium]